LAQTTLSSEDEKRMRGMSQRLFQDRISLSLTEVTHGIQTLAKEWNVGSSHGGVTDNEMEYIKKVFELFDGDHVNQKEFCLVVSLAERLNMME
jgi:hypothetical protein